MATDPAHHPLRILELAVTQATTVVAQVRALSALATELARAGDAARAFVYAANALELSAQVGDAHLNAETRHAVGRCHFYLADFMPALEHLLAAAEIYQSCGDRSGAAEAFAGIGLCQHRLGAQDEAVASLLRALESARDLGLADLEVNVYNSLGSALIAANRVDEAARYLAAGIEIAQDTDDRNLLTKLLLNQGVLAQRRGDNLRPTNAAAAHREYENGLAQVTYALALARELQNPYDEAQCLGQSGTMLRLLDRRTEAATTLDRTLALGRALNDPLVQAEALMEQGILLLAEGQLELARQCLADAVALARRIGAHAVLGEACEMSSLVLERLGDFAGALFAYKEFHAVRETELAGSRKHVANAAQLWLDFQEASRQASQYREKAESLAADRAVLTKEARVLTKQSHHDPLTELLNRRGLEARIGALLHDSDARPSPFTVALIDVDLFKKINDMFSHTVGDTVLRRVASVIREHCRQNDLPVRYGGDEFLLVLAVPDLAAGTRVVQRLKRAIDNYYWPSVAPGLKVTLSIGIAARQGNQALAETVSAADRALYDAKARGRDRVAIAT